VDSLRNLGHQFGVGITSLGIDVTRLDDLPSPTELLSLSAAEFEAVHSLLHIQRVTLATQRNTIDWTALSALRKKHDSVSEMARWLAACLEKRSPLRS
jgi:hypothetical protein